MQIPLGLYLLKIISYFNFYPLILHQKLKQCKETVKFAIIFISILLKISSQIS